MRDDEGQPAFNGLVYPSRNNFPATCVALFDRAGAKVRVVADIDLEAHAYWPAFVGGWRIGIISHADGR